MVAPPPEAATYGGGSDFPRHDRSTGWTRHWAQGNLPKTTRTSTHAHIHTHRHKHTHTHTQGGISDAAQRLMSSQGRPSGLRGVGASPPPPSTFRCRWEEGGGGGGSCHTKKEEDNLRSRLRRNPFTINVRGDGSCPLTGRAAAMACQDWISPFPPREGQRSSQPASTYVFGLGVRFRHTHTHTDARTRTESAAFPGGQHNRFLLGWWWWVYSFDCFFFLVGGSGKNKSIYRFA